MESNASAIALLLFAVFTIGHSLARAFRDVADVAEVAVRPVAPVIALSIAFMAHEALVCAAGQGAAVRQAALHGAGIIGCFALLDGFSSFSAPHA